MDSIAIKKRKILFLINEAFGAIRNFFFQKNYLEVHTPTLVRSPGMEVHTRPFELKKNHNNQTFFLPTSPEFHMKRILCEGEERIFQIQKSFRDEPRSPIHREEFWMLEWYSANHLLSDCIEESVALLNFISEKFNVKIPVPEIFTVEELFNTYGFDLSLNSLIEYSVQKTNLNSEQIEKEPFEDLFYRLWLNEIEPHFNNRFIIVKHYPEPMKALSKVQTINDKKVALRFEIYLNGIELCNGYEELQDEVEQRKRFEFDLNQRKTLYPDWPVSPIDEDFLSALKKGLPNCSGNAMGIERILVAFGIVDSIHDLSFF